MLLEFSHILAFSILFVNSLFDIFSEKGDVPSVFSVIGILGGIILHAVHAFQAGSIQPLTWMITVGMVFSLYGWFAYWAGMWGGADALAMTVIGFATPYSVSGPNAVFGISLFINIFLVSSVYAVLFTIYRALKSGKLRSAFINRLKSRKEVLSIQMIAAGIFSLIYSSSTTSAVLFGILACLILLYHLVKELEDADMSKSIPLSEVEVGDVIDTGNVSLEESRERNLLGKLLHKACEVTSSSFLNSSLMSLEEKYGYSEIVGVTEEELGELESQGVKEVEVKEGLRLVPVFPVALVLTEAGLLVSKYFILL